MDIRQYLDSTYLKTAIQAGVSEEQNKEIVKGFIQEAIDESFKLIMIRPEYVALAKEMVKASCSKVNIGTVIDFPGGKSSVEEKLEMARKAILDGADDLDFVCNYEAFKKGEVSLVKDEILRCTKLGIESGKIVKWIIEVAALSDQQIIKLSVLIKNTIIDNFKEDDYSSVFVKSSTGFYVTENNLPNGATLSSVVLMLENASPLPIKAAGGVRTYDDVLNFVKLGVKRIGTSAAKTIANGQVSNNDY